MGIRTVGKPELLSDPRFNTLPERAKHMPELNAIIEQWLQSFPTRDEPLKILADHRILSAPVLDIGHAMNHPQMKARGVMQEVDHPGVGSIPLPRAPFVVSDASVEIRARTVFLGEHNEAVLGRYLGYSKARVAELTTRFLCFSQVTTHRRERTDLMSGRHTDRSLSYSGRR